MVQVVGNQKKMNTNPETGKSVRNRNRKRRENARAKGANNGKLNDNSQSGGQLSRFKGQANSDGYDTEQLITKVGSAAKNLAEAQGRLSKRVFRRVDPGMGNLTPVRKENHLRASNKGIKETKKPLNKRGNPGKGHFALEDKEMKKPLNKNWVVKGSRLKDEGEKPSVDSSNEKDEDRRSGKPASTDSQKIESKKDGEIGGGKIGSDRFRGRKDIASIVSSCCVEAGFEPTGLPLRKFHKDYFEKTGLKEHYARYLAEKQLPAACDSQKELIERKLDMVDCLKAEKDFSAGTIAGVPGCGKSTVLKKIQGQATDTILLYANPNLESCYKSIDNSFYTQTALVADINHTFATILIDEYTLCESAEILLLQRKFEASRVFLFGDRCQGDIDSLISPEWLKVPRIFSGKKSYRFGKETAALLKEFGLDIEGADIPDKVEKSIYEGKVDEDSQCLCFSTKTRDDLLDCSINCKLVEGTQGQEFERVTLFVAEWDQEYFSNSQLLLVGLTRHKTYLALKTAPEIDLRNSSVAEVKSHSYA